VERYVSSSALLSFLVGWHDGSERQHALGVVIFAHPAGPLDYTIFCLYQEQYLF
jgi:hypothetical protein